MNTYTADDLVLCQSADGFSLHPPGSTDEEIANGDAPYLVSGPGEPTDADFERALKILSERERETWYTWRTDAAHGGLWADSADEALASLVREGEWAEIGSDRESRDIADGAWLTIFEDGVPVLRRGLMP